MAAMLRLQCIVVLGVVLLVAGCDDSKPSGAGAPATTKDGLPMKFSPFTVDTVKSLDGLVQVGEPYKAARKQLDARLGMSIYHDTGKQMWAVADGEECWTIGLTPADGAVQAIAPPARLIAADGLAYQHCVAASSRNQCFRDGANPGECTDQFPGPGL